MDTGIIVETKELAAGIYSTWIQTDLATRALCGQYVRLAEEQQDQEDVAIGICEIAKEEKQIRLIYRKTDGRNALIADLAVGNEIELKGPLGEGFPIDVTKPQGSVLLIGGGVGVGPLLQLAKEIPWPKIVILGFAEEPFLKEEFTALGCSTYVTTETGTIGIKGNVMGAMFENSFRATMVYSCGPKAMLSAVRQYAKTKQITCYTFNDKSEERITEE